MAGMQIFAKCALPIAAAGFAAVIVAPAATAQAVDQPLAGAVVDFSANGCYGIASGRIALPDDRSPDALDKTIHAVDTMGLAFGVDSRVLKELGTLGQTLISRATMGSKALAGGDIVVTFGGPQPGCRVLLLGTASIQVTESVSSGLQTIGWKAVPSMTAQRGAAERRAFVKRDGQGNPYLMNLWTISDPTSAIRLITTTIRIPAGVTLPPGL